MEKVKVTLTTQNDKRYAVVKVNPAFADCAKAANYSDLPRDGERIEITSDDLFIAEIGRKVKKAEVAIEKWQRFLLLPPKSKKIKVAGHEVIVQFVPAEKFRWAVSVELPIALIDEAGLHTIITQLGCAFKIKKEYYKIFLIAQTESEEEYFRWLKKEMKKLEKEISELREWRSQLEQHVMLPGNVRLIVRPGNQVLHYEAEVVAPRPLVEKARTCGLALGKREWRDKKDSLVLSWPLRSETEVAGFLDIIKSEVREALETEIVAQHSF